MLFTLKPPFRCEQAKRPHAVLAGERAGAGGWQAVARGNHQGIRDTSACILEGTAARLGVVTLSGAGQRGAWRRWGLFRVGYRPARASLPIGSSPTMLRPPILRQSRDEGGGMPSSTRTNMASALAASMLATTTTMGSGRCCASGSVRNGASRRISFRFVPAPFSQCTTRADAATPCLAPSCLPLSDGSSPHPGTRQESSRLKHKPPDMNV